METSPAIVKPTKPPKPLNAREKNFVLLIHKGLKGNKAIELSGYNMVGDVATAYASKLLAKGNIKSELVRLQNEREHGAMLDYKSDIASRYPKAMEVYDDLMVNGNDYVRKGVADAIIDRVSPKVTRNESVKYTLPAKEKARIDKLISAIDITPKTVDKSEVIVDNSSQN